MKGSIQFLILSLVLLLGSLASARPGIINGSTYLFAYNMELGGTYGSDYFVYYKDSGFTYQDLILPNGDNFRFTYFSPGWTDLAVARLDDNYTHDVILYDKVHGGGFTCLTTATGEFVSRDRGCTQYHAWSPGWEIHTGQFDNTSTTREDLFFYSKQTGAYAIGFSDGNGGLSYIGGQWSPDWEVHVTQNLNPTQGASNIVVLNRQYNIGYLCILSNNAFTYQAITVTHFETLKTMGLIAD